MPGHAETAGVGNDGDMVARAREGHFAGTGESEHESSSRPCDEPEIEGTGKERSRGIGDILVDRIIAGNGEGVWGDVGVDFLLSLVRGTDEFESVSDIRLGNGTFVLKVEADTDLLRIVERGDRRVGKVDVGKDCSG